MNAFYYNNTPVTLYLFSGFPFPQVHFNSLMGKWAEALRCHLKFRTDKTGIHRIPSIAPFWHSSHPDYFVADTWDCALGMGISGEGVVRRIKVLLWGAPSSLRLFQSDKRTPEHAPAPIYDILLNYATYHSRVANFIYTYTVNKHTYKYHHSAVSMYVCKCMLLSIDFPSFPRIKQNTSVVLVEGHQGTPPPFLGSGQCFVFSAPLQGHLDIELPLSLTRSLFVSPSHSHAASNSSATFNSRPKTVKYEKHPISYYIFPTELRIKAEKNTKVRKRKQQKAKVLAVFLLPLLYFVSVVGRLVFSVLSNSPHVLLPTVRATEVATSPLWQLCCVRSMFFVNFLPSLSGSLGHGLLSLSVSLNFAAYIEKKKRETTTAENSASEVSLLFCFCTALIFPFCLAQH